MPRCPVCSREVTPHAGIPLPFCSDRCRVVDLARWLDESYAVPSLPAPEDEDDEHRGGDETADT